MEFTHISRYFLNFFKFSDYFILTFIFGGYFESFGAFLAILGVGVGFKKFFFKFTYIGL